MIDLGLFFNISTDVAMATNFVKNDKLCTFVAVDLEAEWDNAVWYGGQIYTTMQIL